MRTGWGKAVNSNKINWGQCAINNISFGSCHSLSHAKETEIVGDEINNIINFKARVSALGGAYESEPILLENLESLDTLTSKTNLFVTPNSFNSTNIITNIPATFTVSEGRIKTILMQNIL